MASTSSSHQQNAFSGIEPPNKRRKVEESSRLFDVFINHRGPDVKHTLATQFYNSLEQRGIRVFLDSQEKELGTSFPSTIENAIRSASVHIAIFSKGYAHSPWCLAELVLMLQSNAKIIPVFYEVQPWELRYIENAVYSGAFLEYEKKGRYMDKINEWKQALQSVSFTTGYEFNVSDSSDCKEIVSAVEIEVQRTKKLHVAEHPVGLHKLVKDFERKCLHNLVQDFEYHCRMKKAGKEKANVVGIYGMGGVGKTTLSKELFNQKRSQYTRASFLFDVREAAARAELPSLQSKLLEDLFCEDHRFQSLEEGTNCLRNRLERSSSSSFLIVLDDSDHVEQLHALIPMDILNKYVNSLVIITTRDVGVLVAARIEIGYHLKGLDREDGKELFCWHAFQQSHPRSGYEDLVETFVKMCGGLPLSLQVLGRHVSSKGLRYWREELIKVSKTLPGDVKKRLKISFDSLDNEEKQIFMDVACFFIDQSKTMAMSIWEGSGWSSHHALETLKDKCLLEEVEIRYRPFLDWKWKSRRAGFAIRMHDHLRDLGREMADELSYPRRVWRPQHLKSLELKGFQNILAQTKGRCFHSILDESMDCQITYFIKESEDSSDTSLLWLQLDYLNCHQLVFNSEINPSIPSWIPLQNLQCLRIRGGCFERLWQSDMQVPSHLKELHITGTFLQEFPDLSGKSDNMEDVVLDAMEFQMDIWSLLGSLGVNLRSLNVIGSKLTGELASTDKSLVINDCKLPRDGEVALNKEGWSRTIMSGVENLEIKACNLVRKIIITGNCCQRLQSLKICKLENLIEADLARIETLRFLKITDCKNLKRLSLTSDLSNLIELKIKKCTNLERVLGISDATKLTRLCIKECPELDELPSLRGVSCLEEIEIDSCEKLKNITLPTTLTSLSARRCRGLQRVTGDLTKLTQLSIEDCPELEELPSLCRISCLEELEIDSCEKLQNIALPTTLTSLSVQRCRGLQRVTATGDLTMLTQLIIEDCPELEEFPSLCKVSYLEEIEIDSCEKLQNIALPTTLISLSVQRCRGLQRVTATGDLTMLTLLIIKDCPELEEFPSLCKVSCLEEIVIDSCEKLQNITLPTTLTSLSVRRCRGLQRVTATGDLTMLTRLIIEDCPELEELPSLCRVNLVAINPCEKLQNIPELHASQSIKLFYCSNAVIRNSIHKSKSVPRELHMIGRAVDGAVSSLNKNLFCDVNIDVDGVIEIGTLDGTYYPNWSKLRAVIICLLVVVDGSTSVEGINRSLSPSTGYRIDYEVYMTVREGEWIITMVACDESVFSFYHTEIVDILRMQGIMKKGFRVEVKKDEDCKKVLLTIVDRLYSL